MEASGCCNINISTGLEQSFFIKAFICLKNLSVAVMLNILLDVIQSTTRDNREKN